MSKYIKAAILYLAVILALTDTVSAGGLSSHFTEVKLKDMVPGRAYSVKKMTQMPLDVINTTEALSVDIAIEAEKPVAHNLVPGYEPIPDISWVKIKKDYFKKVGPKESIETDIIIKIPPRQKYYGKKYQVYIYSHTAGEGTFRIGLMGRILFSTTPSRAQDAGKIKAFKNSD